MPSRRRWLYLYMSAALAAAFIVMFGPFVTARSVRAWLNWKARQEGCVLRIGKIEAPLGQTISVYDLHLQSSAPSPFRISLDLAKAEADVNFGSLLHFSRARLLRRFAADNIRLVVTRPEKIPGGTKPFDWTPLQDFVADSFAVSGSELRVENGTTQIALHAFTLQTSELESGRITIREMDVTTPWFHKNFSQLRGAASWQESRLTIGALSLMRGLDLESITIDLGHLADRRLSMQTSLDVFGGQLRANISSEDHPDRRTWDIAGAASEISLAQLSDGLEFGSRAGGILHALKFTFRGTAQDLPNSTASAWAEITGLTWRDRTADTIMIGASLYNRAVQVEQLYVKQRKNQLNASGVFALPEKSADWLNPDFRGDLSASINELGDFAQLFGANPSEFAGEISVVGNVSAQNRQLGGQLSLQGTEMRVFGADAGSWKARANLKESQLEVEECELMRDQDFFLAHGSIDLRAPHDYSGEFSASVSSIAKYWALVPARWQLKNPDGGLQAEWNATEKAGAQSGKFKISGTALRSDSWSWLRPFEAELEGEYSPKNIFLRHFELNNEHAFFGAFVTIADDYLQLQQLQLAVNGRNVATGNIFLPISFARAFPEISFLAALNAKPAFDVSLTIPPADLSEIALALSPSVKISGYVDAILQIEGGIDALSAGSILHLRNASFDGPQRFAADLETHLQKGNLQAQSTLAFAQSDLVRLDLNFPFRLQKEQAGYSIVTEGAASAIFDLPAVFLAKVPRFFSGGFLQEGIFTGELSFSNSLVHPLVTGELQLIDGKLVDDKRVAGRLSFTGAKATINFVNLTSSKFSQSARGEIDFSSLNDLQIKLQPLHPWFAPNLSELENCVSAIRFPTEFSRGGTSARPVRELDFRGGLFSPDWAVTLPSNDSSENFDLTAGERAFRFCPEGEPLILRTAQPGL